jgi:hypothetical protein
MGEPSGISRGQASGRIFWGTGVRMNILRDRHQEESPLDRCQGESSRREASERTL